MFAYRMRIAAAAVYCLCVCSALRAADGPPNGISEQKIVSWGGTVQGGSTIAKGTLVFPTGAAVYMNGSGMNMTGVKTKLRLVTPGNNEILIDTKTTATHGDGMLSHNLTHVGGVYNGGVGLGVDGVWKLQVYREYTHNGTLYKNVIKEETVTVLP